MLSFLSGFAPENKNNKLSMRIELIPLQNFLPMASQYGSTVLGQKTPTTKGAKVGLITQGNWITYENSLGLIGFC